jgi:outer membrane protein OmpA-like peptidoglycan-associated protein
MYKFILILLGAIFLAGYTYAQGIPPASTLLSPTAETAVPANPLHQILDSLRERPALKGLKIKLRTISFNTNSFELTSGSAAYLDTVASVLNKFPALKLEIGGHTDNIGTDHDNQILSENRARAVHNRLIEYGNVVAKRLSFRGYGESKPVATNTTDAGRLLNRRVEMQFIGLDDQQTAKIYLLNGQIISAPLVYVNNSSRTVLYKTSENAPLVELPCGSIRKIIFADSSTQIMDCPAEASPIVAHNEPKPDTPQKTSSFYLHLHGASGYMIGQRPAWTSKTAGYAHVLGFGGGLAIGYRLSRNISVEAGTGYWRWSTQVDYKAGSDGPVLRQYYSQAVQVPLTLSLPIHVGPHMYVMPEGGINLLRITTGFDGDWATSNHFQTHYGGTIGYTTDRSRPVWLDFGLFYRSYQTTSQNEQTTLPAMRYSGLKLGLGFSF